MTPQPLKIRADVEMKCFQFDGVLHIKEAMKKAEAAGNDDCPVKIKLVAPPLYVLTTHTLDKEQGITVLNNAIKACTEAIDFHKGKLVVKEAARAVSERDDKLLAEHMLKLSSANKEVDGDEGSEEEEEDTGMGEVDLDKSSVKLSSALMQENTFNTLLCLKERDISPLFSESPHVLVCFLYDLPENAKSILHRVSSIWSWHEVLLGLLFIDSLSINFAFVPMVPNLDLLFLSFIYGSLISCFLLLAIFLLLICLLLSASLVFLAILLIDIYDAISSFSWMLDSFMANVKLAFVLITFIAMKRTFEGLLALIRLLVLVMLEAKERAYGLGDLKA
ncbi:uncharacterized protein A4U43_C05F19020 [Asparagus officinalis]|uniref:Uncharacterized protein n=1 Tax=Asparagus officinalis TaxID=4686 RepID=A0A5P1ETE5_ASPOF|nr:uncharacterized protein A4U43_C05F19020 [Asparagus officinalis]